MRFWIFLVAGAAMGAPCTEPDKSCLERMAVGEGRYIHVYRSHPLAKRELAIERAFILIHGTQRNGADYFKTAIAATKEAGFLEKTLVIAPYFKANDGSRCKDVLEEGELGFSCNGWKDGEPAFESNIDSFTAMDRLLAALDDKTRFPALKEIVVAGHSAGGQYVQRYAAGNRMEPKLSVPVRYLVANPSSYLYLETWRPVKNPEARCPGFDKYKYGLNELTGYVQQTGAEAIRTNYPRRNVTYLLGELDTTDEHSLDKSCQAMAQGPNRLERGLAYSKRLVETYSAAHQLVRVPGCDHSADCMYRSEVGRNAVFAGETAHRR
jgi:pimeloyl-ACP methyl ester carboxylesterase